MNYKVHRTYPVQFAFNTMQRVRVAEINALATVVSRMNNVTGINEYKVRYWFEGRPTEEWFYEFELEAA